MFKCCANAVVGFFFLASIFVSDFEQLFFLEFELFLCSFACKKLLVRELLCGLLIC